ncbi:MAG: hypothetical protein NWF04_01030 [Candidatus Bathyarchaeota archaeon]|nr:hypothetical protein [Candidatus Bathyarchaeota archaeon]
MKTERTKIANPPQDFDDVLLQAIEDGLTNLGESPKQIVYFHLEKKFSLKKEDIPKHLENFSLALQSIFGVGGRSIETMILKSLCLKYGINYDDLKHTEFLGAIKEIKQKTYV